MIELIKWIEKREIMTKGLDYLKDSTDNITLMSRSRFIKTPSHSDYLLFFFYLAFSSITYNEKSSSMHNRNQLFLLKSWS